jgi:Flp pilus assembly protein TadD
MNSAFDSQRRKLLMRACQGASAALLRGLPFPGAERLNAQPAALPGADLVDAQFHLHPRYRSRTTLDDAVAKIKAGSDEFVGEGYHDRIAAILGDLSDSLLKNAQGIQPLEKVLVAGFEGFSYEAARSRIIRPGPALEVREVSFSPEAKLAKDPFLKQLRLSLGAFSSIYAAEFQITAIDLLSEKELRTRIRYELVGTGPGFHREQRAGEWELEWQTEPPRLRSWKAFDETRSRSAQPWYQDIAPQALGRNSSYAEQMLRGTDYWRTVLDGASGTDIYGHNGVSIGDIDGDGWDDVYVCQPAGLPNRLYRNRGDGTFEDITAASGLGILENTACAIFGDFSYHGRQDLIVVRANGPLLFQNEGGGKFRLRPDAFQFANAPQGTFTGASAADYDRDGWLDIYFCLYVYYQGADQYRYPTPYFAAENGPPNFMMRNNRDGTFGDVTAASGLNQNNTRYSFCCAWGDYNRDGWPDLYVVNDFGKKNLYRNNGDGTFTDIAPQAGVEDAGAGMGACWFDYDNDGREDLYVADMWTAAGERISAEEAFQREASREVRSLYRKHAMGNSLFRNQGGAAFGDATALAGTGTGRWAWSSDTWDFDHDGFADLYVVNGMVSGALREDLNSFFWRQVVAKSPNSAQSSQDYENGWNAINDLLRADYSWSGFERNVFYANNGKGTFSNVSGAVDLDFLEDGRAFALADFDHDGRQEVFVKSRNAPQLRLLKNVQKELPPAISFRLRGVKSNPDAIGASVELETSLGKQTKTLQAGSGFLSQHSKELFFGLGQAKGAVKASIHWPSGLVQRIDNLPINHRIWVEEGIDPSRMDAYRSRLTQTASLLNSKVRAESLPSKVEAWLLAPLPAPDFSLLDLSGRTRTLSAMRGKPVLLVLTSAQALDLSSLRGAYATWRPQGLQLLVLTFETGSGGIRPADFPILKGTEDVAGIYNVLYRYLFDRHRDLSLPTSFLIDAQGDFVKVYQGPLDPHVVEADFKSIPQTAQQRMAKSLPFAGDSETYEFGRNHLSLGSVFFQRGYYDPAEDFFKLALRDDPSIAEAHYGLGSVYLKQDKNSDARVSFEQALKLTPAYPDTGPNSLNNLGLLATREGRLDEAAGYFQQALRANPQYWIALENLGNAYRQMKRWDEARATLESALSLRPQDPEVNYSLGMVYAQTDDTGRAYEYLQTALRLRPVYPEALNNLGILFLRTRRRDEAVAKFEECIRVAPGFDQSYLNLARVYSVEGDPEKARVVLRELLRQHPDHAQGQEALRQLR